jgi:pyruvate dehydrogenase phosphatase
MTADHFSTRSRDDVTVEVIFFGQGPDSRTGTVEINKEASASEEPPKAKL